MVQERLRSRYGSLQDWKAVGAEIGVSGGMAFRVATTDYEPRDNEIRKRLGLPIMAPAPVCAVCGVVHSRQCRQVPAWVGQAVAFLRSHEKRV